MNALLEGLKIYAAKLKGYALAALALTTGILFFLFKREQNKAAEAEAASVAAEKKGEINVLKKETQNAEHDATDSRSEYERLAAKHRQE